MYVYVIKNYIFFYHISAGGQLALSVGMYLSDAGFPLAGIVPLYPMTQVITGTSRSYLNKVFAIHPDAAAQAASIYVQGDQNLRKGFLNGELYNTALTINRKLIEERFNYPDKNHKFSNTSNTLQIAESSRIVYSSYNEI